jgi:hypothetical protein
MALANNPHDSRGNEAERECRDGAEENTGFVTALRMTAKAEALRLLAERFGRSRRLAKHRCAKDDSLLNGVEARDSLTLLSPG